MLGIDSGICRRVAIITYEAEINLVIHAGGGMLKAEIFEDHVVLIAEDEGPGIADIDKAMTEGLTRDLVIRRARWGSEPVWGCRI